MTPTPAIPLSNPASKARRLAWFGSPVLIGVLAVGGWYGWKAHYLLLFRLSMPKEALHWRSIR